MSLIRLICLYLTNLLLHGEMELWADLLGVFRLVGENGKPTTRVLYNMMPTFRSGQMLADVHKPSPVLASAAHFEG